jgi:hypothetical protein
MDQTNKKTEPQEQQIASAPRPWVTPSFERTSLKEALSTGKGKGTDGPFSYS